MYRTTTRACTGTYLRKNAAVILENLGQAVEEFQEHAWGHVPVRRHREQEAVLADVNVVHAVKGEARRRVPALPELDLSR